MIRMYNWNIKWKDSGVSYISIKITPFGNNVNNIFLKGVLNLIRKVEIAGVNTAKLPVLSNEEKQELLVKIRKASICTRCYASAQPKVA